MSKFRIAFGALFLTLTLADAFVFSTFNPQHTRAANEVAAPAATVGKPAPDFSVKDTNGKTQTLKQYKGKFVVIEWVNFDCPFVKKHYDSKNMQTLQDKYGKSGVVWLSVNSSAPSKQGAYEAKRINELIKEKGAKPTAYLLDTDGAVGHAYGAKVTPHMFVIDKKGTLVYAGAIDDKQSVDANDVKTSKNYVAAALDSAIAGKPVATPTSRAYGCGVKY